MKKLILALAMLASPALAGPIVVEPEPYVASPNFFIEASGNWVSDGSASFGGGAGLGYYLSDGVAITVDYAYSDLERAGHLIQLGVQYELSPSQVINPYATLGAGYGVNSSDFAVYGGVGIEYSVLPNVSLFTEGEYLYFFDAEDGAAIIKVGARFKF